MSTSAPKRGVRILVLGTALGLLLYTIYLAFGLLP